MSDLGDLLAPERVHAGVAAANKKLLLGQLGQLAGRALDLDGREVAERLAAREKLGATGFGGGVAIPHGRIAGLPAMTGLFARLAQPIDYGAVDGAPVDLVFLLLSPELAGAEHLKALARISRRLRDAAFSAKLRGAGSPDALYALLATPEARGVA